MPETKQTIRHKRIIWTTAESDLLSHNGAFGITIRASRNATDSLGTFVIEGPWHERRLVDRLAALFDEERSAASLSEAR